MSGGQKQRVSLARALYLHFDLLVLDNILSGLDADTEEQVFRRVFRPGGLLRWRCSMAVLCTHSIRHLPAADYTIALGDGTIVEQGTFNQLMTSQGYVQRLGLKESSDGEASSVKHASKNAVDESGSRFLHLTMTTTTSPAPTTDELRKVGDIPVYKHYFKAWGS
ncbi:P-loop containing nucleoside triphosphate hydrolase protein [Hypoxylon sp. FL1150]|nr:P-loop containing nucleoside triphosphate hydrolase protein [Hypoxylon sp. FL1150]